MALNPDYATLADARAFARIVDVTDTADDTQMSLAITAASRAIDEATHRQFGLATGVAARYYTPRYNPRNGRWVVDIDDVMTSAGMIVKGDLDWDGVAETVITDYRLRPFNAAQDGMAWESILFGITVVGFTALASSNVSSRSLEGSLELTATFGWTTVPVTVKNACLLQALRFYKRRDSPYGIAGSPEMGSEMRLLAKLDVDVALMLKPYTLDSRRN